jgi:hypothetical protein
VEGFFQIQSVISFDVNALHLKLAMEAIFLLLAFAGPVVGFVWADRRSRGSFPHLIASAAFGGFTVGLLFALSAAVQIPGNMVAVLLSWIVVFTSVGTGLGVLGVIARMAGSSLRS